MGSNKTKKNGASKGSRNKDLGRRGEEAAARFMVKRGYEILDRNFTCPFGESDIVAKDFDTIVFVEVKTRTSIDRGLPEDAVTPEKRKRYERIAMAYLQEHEETDMNVRFDVIAIMVIEPDKAFIRHHINAFGVG